MSQVIDLCEDSDDSGESPNAASVPSLPIFRQSVATWEVRLSELADCRKIHDHCNVPRYFENTQLANWVPTQRRQYRLYLEEKKSSMTLSRTRDLENLGFEWNPSLSKWKRETKKPSLDDDATRIRERVMESPEYMQQHSLKNNSVAEKSTAIKSTSLSNPKNPTGVAKSTSTSSRVEPQNIWSVEAEDTQFDEMNPDGSPWDLVLKPSLYSDRQTANSLSPDKSNTVESKTRKDASQAKVPRPAHHQKSINSLSHSLLVAGPPKHDFLRAKKPANLRQGAESQLETATSKDMFRANPKVAEPLQHKHDENSDS
jgi:hypothetical protein